MGFTGLGCYSTVSIPDLAKAGVESGWIFVPTSWDLSKTDGFRSARANDAILEKTRPTQRV